MCVQVDVDCRQKAGFHVVSCVNVVNAGASPIGFGVNSVPWPWDALLLAGITTREWHNVSLPTYGEWHGWDEGDVPSWG